MNAFIDEVILAIKCWKPKCFVNPFYSPSLDFWINFIKPYTSGYIKGLQEGIKKSMKERNKQSWNYYKYK